MKYAFYISGSSGRVKKFLLCAKEAMKKSICLVVSEYKIESGLKEILSELDIPSREYNYNELGNTTKEKNRVLSDCILRDLQNKEIDYCFSFGSHILAGDLLVKYRWRLINFHPAILPMYPGRYAIDKAVEENKALLLGNTAHFIDEGMDTGAIIMQSVVPMKAFLDERNYDMVLDLQIEMLCELMDIIEMGCLTIENGRAVIKGADYQEAHIYPKWRRDNKK